MILIILFVCSLPGSAMAFGGGEREVTRTALDSYGETDDDGNPDDNANADAFCQDDLAKSNEEQQAKAEADPGGRYFHCKHDGAKVLDGESDPVQIMCYYSCHRIDEEPQERPLIERTADTIECALHWGLGLLDSLDPFGACKALQGAIEDHQTPPWQR
jgi:hypothetical protein